MYWTLHWLCAVTAIWMHQSAVAQEILESNSVDEASGSSLVQDEDVQISFYGETVYKRSSIPDLDYLILASRILRPSTIYRIVVILYEDCAPLDVGASISRDGVALSTNEIRISALESGHILLRIPPENSNTTANYQLSLYGSYREKGGGNIFSHESPLEFSRKFLSITISTGRAIYNAEQVIYMRIVMLTTAMKPYTGIVDLFMIDPDGYVIRKWNSKELNVGVLSEQFQLPLYPKVGFWTIRVIAEGQIEEHQVKVEKHYLPKWEIIVTMPAFVLDNEELIEAFVDGSFVVERLARGDVKVEWYAKKIDHWTPLHNDSVLYRQRYRYDTQVANLYHSGLYNNYGFGLDPNVQVQSFDDRYANSSYGPKEPLINEWTYLRTDYQMFRPTETFQPFPLYLKEVEDIMGQRAGIQVRASAEMIEYFYNDTQPAFAETRILEQSLTLKFLGHEPFIFKPGMQFDGQVVVMFDDHMPLTSDQLRVSRLKLSPFALLKSGLVIAIEDTEIPEMDEEVEYPHGDDDDDYDEFLEEFQDIEEAFQKIALKSAFAEFREKGVHQFTFQVPEDAVEVEVVAEFYNPDFGTEKADLRAFPTFSKNNHFVKVITSTKQLKEGEYVVFHAKTNFPVEFLDWMLVSKDIILESGRELGENIHPEIITFSTVVSSEMSPGFHIIVHVTTLDDEVISDSIFIPVDAISSHDIEFQAIQIKDHTMKTVELTCRGDPGAVFMLATLRVGQFPAQGVYTLTKAYLMESLYKFEEGGKHVHRVLRTDRTGETTDQMLFFAAMDYEPDTNRSFASHNLVVFANRKHLALSDSALKCNITGNEFPCATEGCFTASQRCDGKEDCYDGFDESNCVDVIKRQQTENRNYRMSRQSRFEDFYDIMDGDWAWIMTNIDEDGEQFFTLPVPETPDDFYINVMSLSKENGIGLYADPPVYNTIRPIDFYCEAPESVHRGESVCVRCIFINRGPNPLEAAMILSGSEDYAFIHVEHFGYVSSYAPRLSYGDYHHYVYVRGYSEMEASFPIAPQIEQGVITVTMKLAMQINSVIQEMEIEIIGEGSIVHRHTSLLLDLKNRANVLRFMNIIVDETPIIPYEIYRRYVAGSADAHVSICGDVIGPIFPNDEPVNLESMFPTGNGRFGKGTDYHTFNLGANTWQLHYLRLTNQMVDDNKVLAKEVFKQMNVEYTAVMRRFTAHGSLRNFDDSSPSLWLTAWTVSIMTHVSFQDWEDFIYIDPQVVTSAALWVINFQNADGAFLETEYYQSTPLHYPMNPIQVHNMTIHAPLTALVLIMLEDAAAMVQGNAKQYSASARQRAVSYLERNLALLDDGYAIAITTYALARSKSSMADVAFGQMMRVAREEDSMIYWGRTPIDTNRVRYEFNRPFLEGKDYQNNDALAVEATAYALLSIFQMEGGGITFTQEKIVQWINTMRLGDGGFISTVDTLVALQALVLYSYHSRIKDITDLRVEIDLPDSNSTESFFFTGLNLAKGQRIDIPNVWGHMNVFAHGAGQAVAQLDVNYGVDYEPFKDQPATDCFKLSIQEHFHGRNKSEITVLSCLSWTLTTEGSTSGLAMLVVDIPSGYVMEQPAANSIVKSGIVPEMKDADVTKPGKTIWYFDRVPNQTRCFEHTVRRYFAVANLTRTRQAILVEPYRPERFVVKTFNATSLYILSVCEVCGSFQCPYCPFFSSASALAGSLYLFTSLVISLLLTR